MGRTGIEPVTPCLKERVRAKRPGPFSMLVSALTPCSGGIYYLSKNYKNYGQVGQYRSMVAKKVTQKLTQ